jgi:hypothetical protein
VETSPSVMRPWKTTPWSTTTTATTITTGPASAEARARHLRAEREGPGAGARRSRVGGLAIAQSVPAGRRRGRERHLGGFANLLCYSGLVSAQGRTAHVLTPPSRPKPDIRQQLEGHLSKFLVVAAAAALVLAFFVAVYKVKHHPMPIGYDTPRYLFQTTLVGDLGLSHVPHLLPPPKKSLATRTGFPVVVLTLSRLLSTSTYEVGAMVPPAAATALALAAGAFVSWGLHRSEWNLGATVLIVGTSAVMVRLLVPEGYTDNLISTAVLVAALVPTVSAMRDGPGRSGAIGLLAVGGVIHPQFFGLFAVILALVVLAYLPGSLRAWRRKHVGLLHTPSARLGMILAGSLAVAAALFFGLVRSWPVGAKQVRVELLRKMSQDLPLYRFPFTVPVAAMGAVFLGALGLGQPGSSGDPVRPSPERRTRFVARFLLILSLAWGLVTVIGVIDFYRGSTTAAHRLLSFLIPFPILMAVGILFLGRSVAARTRRAVGVAIVVLGIGAVAFLGYRDLYVNIPAHRGIGFLETGKVRDAATARAYLDRARVPERAPVVFVIDDRGPNPVSWVPEMAYMIRSVLPTERILHSYVYVGDPENYLAGKPTLRSTPPQYNGNLPRYWPTIQRILPRHPVALLLRSYNAAYSTFVAAHPGSEVAPDVAVIMGPTLPALIEPPPFPTGPRGIVRGGLLAVGTVLILTLIGAGWAVAALPRTLRPFEILALSPAVGMAALVMAGMVVDAAGFRLGGPGGVVAPFLAAAVGALVAWMLRRPRRPRVHSGMETI